MFWLLHVCDQLAAHINPKWSKILISRLPLRGQEQSNFVSAPQKCAGLMRHSS
jgi:hypothetical protein